MKREKFRLGSRFDASRLFFVILSSVRAKYNFFAVYHIIENDDFPEYWLTRNNVLCGMAITDVYHLDSPLLESEMSECSALLKAIIAQAPILRNMSESGFRGTFLLRSGILSTRDGAWLLRVERETYDIVLDRFPWSWVWVKLPWMELPLRVEW